MSIICCIDEDAQLLNEVTSRMTMDNIKTGKKLDDSRIRGYITKQQQTFDELHTL